MCMGFALRFCIRSSSSSILFCNFAMIDFHVDIEKIPGLHFAFMKNGLQIHPGRHILTQIALSNFKVPCTNKIILTLIKKNIKNSLNYKENKKFQAAELLSFKNSVLVYWCFFNHICSSLILTLCQVLIIFHFSMPFFNFLLNLKIS